MKIINNSWELAQCFDICIDGAVDRNVTFDDFNSNVEKYIDNKVFLKTPTKGTKNGGFNVINKANIYGNELEFSIEIKCLDLAKESYEFYDDVDIESLPKKGFIFKVSVFTYNKDKKPPFMVLDGLCIYKTKLEAYKSFLVHVDMAYRYLAGDYENPNIQLINSASH